MLALTPFEFFVRVIPEVLALIFAAYVFTKTKIKLKEYVFSASILSICIFIIRSLPINYGVHTILNIIILTIIVCINMKVDIIQAIKSSLLTAIVLFVCEGINIAILQIFAGKYLENILSNTILKTICTLPSLLGLVGVVGVYCVLLKRKKLKYD